MRNILFSLLFFFGASYCRMQEEALESSQLRGLVQHKCIRVFTHKDSINTVDCSSKNSSDVYFSSYGTKIHRWDWKQNKRLSPLPVSKDGCVAWFWLHQEYKDFLICFDWYKPIVDVVMFGEKQQKERVIFKSPPINSIAVHPQFLFFAYGDDGGGICVSNCKEKKNCFFKSHRDYVWSLACNYEGTLIASGAYMQPIKVWDVHKEKCIASLATGEEMFAWDSFLSTVSNGKNDDANRVTALAFHPKKKDVLLAGTIDVVVWDVVKKRVRSVLYGHDQAVNSILFHPDNHDIIFSCSNDKTIRIWSLRERRCLAVLKGHQEAVKSIVLCPQDPSILISGSWDKTIRVWKIDFGVE